MHAWAMEEEQDGEGNEARATVALVSEAFRSHFAAAGLLADNEAAREKLARAFAMESVLPLGLVDLLRENAAGGGEAGDAGYMAAELAARPPLLALFEQIEKAEPCPERRRHLREITRPARVLQVGRLPGWLET